MRESRPPAQGSEPGQSVTVAVIGELDIATVPRFTARMGELARSGHVREMVVDLSGAHLYRRWGPARAG